MQQNLRQHSHYSTSIKVKYQNYCHHLFATRINQWGKTRKQMNQDYLFFSQTHFYVMHFPRFSCDTLSWCLPSKTRPRQDKKLYWAESTAAKLHLVCALDLSCPVIRKYLLLQRKIVLYAFFAAVWPISNGQTNIFWRYYTSPSIQMEGGKGKK